MSLRNAARWLLRLLIGGLFVYAGAVKLPDPHAFAAQIANYRLLPALPNQFLAVVLPWIELLCGTALLAGWWVRPAALVTSALLLAFLVGLLQALARGIDLECGCFDAHGGTPAGAWTVLRDLALLGASCTLAWWRETAPQGTAHSTQSGGP